MVGSGPNQEEPVGSQRQDQFLNLKRRRDWEFSVYTTQTGGGQSQCGSHLLHEENTRSMQLEIDYLQRRLRHEWCRTTPPSFDPPCGDASDFSYRLRSRTPPSESFSCDLDHIISRGRRVCLAKAWAMTLWARLWIKFPSHLLPVGLKVENFLNGLLSQRSPCKTSERTQWSLLAISTRGWPFTLRTKPWCAKCSHLVWGLWQWDGLIVWERALLAP